MVDATLTATGVSGNLMAVMVCEFLEQSPDTERGESCLVSRIVSDRAVPGPQTPASSLPPPTPTL